MTLGITTRIAQSITVVSVVPMHQAISPSSVYSLRAKLSFLLIGKTRNSIGPLLVGKLTETLRTSVSPKSKTLFFTMTTTVTILFMIILIDEVGDFTIKTG
jgi:hypothetical protein